MRFTASGIAATALGEVLQYSSSCFIQRILKPHTQSQTKQTSGTNFRNMKGASASAHYPLSYFRGAGHLGQAYIYGINKYSFESPSL
jgi:hypothetical protein